MSANSDRVVAPSPMSASCVKPSPLAALQSTGNGVPMRTARISMALVLIATLGCSGSERLTGSQVPGSVRASSSVPLVAQQGAAVVITTEKPFGPVPGTFSTTGAFVETGTLLTEQRIVSAVPSPFGVISHITLLFVGLDGTFTIRTQIIESDAGDENTFTQEGTWVVVDGTGAYATLRGNGKIVGTADHNADLITRIYTGLVFFKP